MKQLGNVTSFISGIADDEKMGPQGSFAFNRSTDFRTNPSQFTLLPKSIKDSGSIVSGLPMWGERACSRIFSYADNGDIYMKESGAWSRVHTAGNSTGNGMRYFGEDSNLYYAQNTTIGKLESACTGSSFTDNFLGAEGGEPTNTKSLDLERSSSQYAYVTDNAGISITSDLTIEAYLKPESYPEDTDMFVILSKWNENGDQRSYKLDIATKSDFFGDGRDGALVISSDTTEDVIDANCTGTAGESTLTVTNEHASFSSIVSGDQILIHQTRGTGADQYQIVEVVSYSSGVVTLLEPLTFSPVHSATLTDANKAQVRLLKQYTDVTVNSGITYTCKAWDGLKGGIFGFFANGTFTCAGTIYGLGKGFRGGLAYQTGLIGKNVPITYGYYAEGNAGIGARGTGTAANGNGSGASGNGSDGNHAISGSGGGNGTQGYQGERSSDLDLRGIPGSSSGDENLVTAQLGGGGAGGTANGTQPVTVGGRGGGIAFLFAYDIPEITGSINFNGAQGTDTSNPYTRTACGGGGAGGSVLIKTVTAVLGTNKITATGGRGGQPDPIVWGVTGGTGADGRVHIDYATSYSGTSSPTLTATQDQDLNAGEGYVLRLHISSTGANSEIYSWDITNSFDTNTWRRYQVTWEDTTSTAEAFINGATLGTKTGSLTSIYNSTASLAIGADFDSSGNPQNYYDGLMDDVRLWNDIRTSSELSNKNDVVLIGNEANLVAYYEFESNLDDSQTNITANDLTGVNTPTYSDDIPFYGITSRNDEDQSNTSGGFASTYTLETVIDESTDTKKIFFVPAKDPQKSFLVNIAAKGAGDWTLTIHDGQNREIASKTITNANLNTGYYEFIFDSVWTPVLGRTYHAHITSTVADGTVAVKTGESTLGASDGTPYAYFTTFYQFLINDEYHPMERFLNLLVIGNGRYVATLQGGNIYEPHALTFPSGERVRCIGFWREYAVFGTWSGSAITDYENGKLFFWDGISDTYNHYINVPEGGVNAMFGTRDMLFIIAGYTGELLVYSGGGQAEKIKRIPYMDNESYIEVAPGSMTMWQTMLSIGVALDTNNSNIHKGIYTFGTKNKNYPYSLGFSYPTSLGDQTSTNVKIGMVFPSGQDLYVGWQNGNTYGIDKISTTNDPYPTGTMELLISDMQAISEDHFPLVIRADHKELNSGESVTLKYRKERGAPWNTIVTQSTERSIETRGTITDRAKEMQFACDIATSVSTSPTVLGISLESDRAKDRKA